MPVVSALMGKGQKVRRVVTGHGHVEPGRPLV